MGHHSRVPHPSPLQMLAILEARAAGASAHEIHRRTGYSNASVLRWFQAWGHEAKTVENWVKDSKIDRTGQHFDDFWPKDRVPPNRRVWINGERRYATPSDNTIRFETALGLK